MRINPFVFGALVLAVFLGVIAAFQGADVWSVSGKISSSGERVTPSATDVETVKGWMTLEQVSTTYDVPVEDILEVFALPADVAPSTALKELESDTFSVIELRAWLQEHYNN